MNQSIFDLKAGRMRQGIAIVCLALTGCLWLSGCAVDPVSGDKHLMLISPEDEAKLGKAYAPQIEKELGGRIPDENLQSYINQVGQKMARVCHHPEFSYSYTAVQDPMVNAFAVPGGHIFITRGLLEKLNSEAELASVLGHETGHVVAQHTASAISRATVMAALVVAAGVGGGARGAGSADFIASCLSLQYSRDDETEADWAGLSYMTQAGYDPNGMVATMRVLDKLQTERPIEFFSTHPNPDSRVTFIQERIESRFSMLGQLKTGKEEYQEHILAVLKEMKKKPEPPADREAAKD
jgi:beta-barrel assembly-enhancing protease